MLDVSVTELPWQIFTDPLAVITGAGGSVHPPVESVTITDAEVDAQPVLPFTVTEYVPAVLTVML